MSQFVDSRIEDEVTEENKSLLVVMKEVSQLPPSQARRILAYALDYIGHRDPPYGIKNEELEEIAKKLVAEKNGWKK